MNEHTGRFDRKPNENLVAMQSRSVIIWIAMEVMQQNLSDTMTNNLFDVMLVRIGGIL